MVLTLLAVVFSFTGLSSGRLPAKQAFADSARVVSLYADGQKEIFTTEAVTVAEALERAGVELGEGDVVEPAAETALPSQGPFNINVYRARPVIIKDESSEQVVQTAYQSPRKAVEAAGVEVYKEDLLRSETVQNIVEAGAIGTQIAIKRSIPVTLLADRKQQALRTQAKTVADFVLEKDIAIGPKDIVEPALKSPIVAGSTISITRVNEVVEVKEEAIPRATKTISDFTQLKGYRQVRTEGADGKKQVTYRVYFRDGEERQRETLKSVTISKPVTQVVVVGTKLNSLEESFYRLRLCESGNNYKSNTGNGYYGAYQFDVSTWRSNGGSGTYPHQAAPAEQDRVAQNLQSRRGWSPWPSCSRKLGLR